MKKVFFDTEFTGLHKKAKLISIGLVCSDSGKSMYLQLADTYRVKDCSDFCRDVVLPLLEPTSYPKEKVKQKLLNWFYEQNDDLTLFCDSSKDIEQFNNLFPEGVESVQCKKLNFLFNFKRKMLKDKIYTDNNLRYHHALDDAVVNKLIYQTKWSKVFTK